jgi:outer membrane lipoprotein-sorting protein
MLARYFARFSVIAALSAMFFGPGAVEALAAPSGDEILKKVEEVMNLPKDRTATIKMTIRDKAGNTKVREMKVMQKGSDKRLFTFLSPADVQGVSFLVIDDDNTYLYTPAFGKIRRIASSARNENFAGTDFTFSDLSKGDYPAKYSATLDKEDAEVYHITCTPKPGADVDYSKVEMVVEKASFMPRKMNLYDKNGKLLKTLENGKIEKIDGYWSTRSMTMTDVQAKHSTAMEMAEMKHDTGVEDKEFSKRNLKKFR